MAILDDTRSDWKARPPTGTLRTVPWDQRVGVSWHWIGPGRGIAPSSSHSLCLDLVNRWQLQHQTRPGDPWKDIGYNALICQHGRAIEGRGLDKAGSHSPGVNWEHVGIQFMVGDLSPTPTTIMTARAQFLRSALGDLGRNIRRDWGHRDDPEASTSCPGNWIETWVKVGGPTATPTAPPPVEEDDMFTDTDRGRLDYVANTAGPRIYDILTEVKASRAQLAALSAAVQALATNAGADPDAIAAIVDDAVRDRLDRIEITVTDDDTPNTPEVPA